MGRKNSTFDIQFMGKEFNTHASSVKPDFYEGIELAVMRGIITSEESKAMLAFFEQATDGMMDVIISVCFAGFNIAAKAKFLDMISHPNGTHDD